MAQHAPSPFDIQQTTEDDFAHFFKQGCSGGVVTRPTVDHKRALLIFCGSAWERIANEVPSLNTYTCPPHIALFDDEHVDGQEKFSVRLGHHSMARQLAYLGCSEEECNYVRALVAHAFATFIEIVMTQDNLWDVTGNAGPQADQIGWKFGIGGTHIWTPSDASVGQPLASTSQSTIGDTIAALEVEVLKAAAHVRGATVNPANTAIFWDTAAKSAGYTMLTS
eukprot:TRINITY_DN57969_c0_g1_i1.p1 TRINITY_DN57969_c0_g1~~TRINITY_DN57969_c0_g1_i1.p1  ORF type:complete len:223 (-),score=30.64 TRINITY_DN57969_c0_g1_i1:309-977(-)